MPPERDAAATRTLARRMRQVARQIHGPRRRDGTMRHVSTVGGGFGHLPIGESNQLRSSQRPPLHLSSPLTRMSEKRRAIAKRLDRIDRCLQRLEQNLEITSETLALFIRFWLNSTVPLPETVQAAARVKGEERYDQIIEALGRRLSQGPKLPHEVFEELAEK